MVEDMITLLESTVQPELRKGRYPDKKVARRVSEVVKAVARELDCLNACTAAAPRGTLTLEAPQESIRVREVRWHSRRRSARNKRER